MNDLLQNIGIYIYPDIYINSSLYRWVVLQAVFHRFDTICDVDIDPNGEKYVPYKKWRIEQFHISSGQISIIPKPECFGQFLGRFPIPMTTIWGDFQGKHRNSVEMVERSQQNLMK